MEKNAANNIEAYGKLGWILDNARSGFYFFTAVPAMQKKVARLYAENPRVAVFDYSGREKPYSYAELGRWAEQQEADVFFVINLQVALRDINSIYNLNLSRDMLADMKRVWWFGMTPDLHDRLIKHAPDFESYVSMRAHFVDETPPEIERKEETFPGTPATQLKVDAYQDLEKKLMSIDIESVQEYQLLSTAATLSNIATAYLENGNYDHALVLFEKANL